MKVKVTGLLTEYFTAGREELPVTLIKPVTVKELLQQIKMSHELVMAVVVNGERRDLNYILQNDDEIVLVSPLAGG